MINIYDPNNLSIVFGGLPILGFAHESMLEIEYENPRQSYYKITTDIHGNISRTRRVNNGIANITLTLGNGSYSNNILSNFVEMDRLNDSGVFSVSIKEPNGTTIFACNYAFVSDVPTQIKCNSSGKNSTVWTIKATEITQN